MKKALIAAAAVITLLSGCSTDSSAAPSSSPTTSAAQNTVTVTGCGSDINLAPVNYCLKLHQQYVPHIVVTDDSADRAHPASILNWSGKDAKGGISQKAIIRVHAIEKAKYEVIPGATILLEDQGIVYVCDPMSLDGFADQFGKSSTIFMLAIQGDVCNPENWYAPK